jgi:hypothetical protein
MNVTETVEAATADRHHAGDGDEEAAPPDLAHEEGTDPEEDSAAEDGPEAAVRAEAGDGVAATLGIQEAILAI